MVIQINKVMTSNKVKQLLINLQSPLGKVPGSVIMTVGVDYVKDSRVLYLNSDVHNVKDNVYIHLTGECDFKQGDTVSIDLDWIVTKSTVTSLELNLSALGVKGRALISEWFRQNNISRSYLERWAHLLEPGDEYIPVYIDLQTKHPIGYKRLTITWGTHQYKLPTNKSTFFTPGDVLLISTVGKIIKIGTYETLSGLVEEIITEGT